MLKLFKHKEKNSIVISVVYVVVFVVYILILLNVEGNEGNVYSFYIFIMICVMVETFKHSLFNLSYYFANGSEYSISKPVMSRLRTNLQLLSIKMNDFVLYNIVYTILRLLPFVITTFVFAKVVSSIYFILLFSLLYVLKAIVGPMTTYTNSIMLDLQLNDKELSRKERVQEYYCRIKDLYPQANIQTFRVLRVIYAFSSVVLYMAIYIYVFQFMINFINVHLSILIGLAVISFINIAVYGFYLNNLESRHDYVLYKE